MTEFIDTRCCREIAIRPIGPTLVSRAAICNDDLIALCIRGRQESGIWLTVNTIMRILVGNGSPGFRNGDGILVRFDLVDAAGSIMIGCTVYISSKHAIL